MAVAISSVTIDFIPRSPMTPSRATPATKPTCTASMQTGLRQDKDHAFVLFAVGIRVVLVSWCIYARMLTSPRALAKLAPLGSKLEDDPTHSQAEHAQQLLTPLRDLHRAHVQGRGGCKRSHNSIMTAIEGVDMKAQ